MKWYRLLAAGAVLGLTVTACGTITETDVAPTGTANAAAAPGPRTSASPSAATSGLPTALASASPSASTSTSVASSTVWFDCTHHGQVKPSDYILSCADAGSVLEHLVWKSWTARQAVATGVHALNDCTPDCVAGKFIDYPAVVRLWRSKPVSAHPGERYFTRITVRYTGPRPPAYTSMGQLVRGPVQWTEPLGPFGP